MRHLLMVLPVSTQLLRDIVEIAAEDGITYWARNTTGTTWCEFDADENVLTDTAFTLDIVLVLRGLERIMGSEDVSIGLRQQIAIAVAMDDGSEIDDLTADLIVQYGLFDQLRYS